MALYNGEPYPGFFKVDYTDLARESVNVGDEIKEMVSVKWTEMAEKALSEFSVADFQREYLCQFYEEKEEPKEESYVGSVIAGGPLSVTQSSAAGGSEDFYIYNGSSWSDASLYTISSNVHSDTITINGAGGDAMVSISPDGNIEYGEDYTPDEAAKVFWEAIALQNPHALRAEIDELKQQICELKYELNSNQSKLKNPTDLEIIRTPVSIPAKIIVPKNIYDKNEDAYERAMRVVE